MCAFNICVILTYIAWNHLTYKIKHIIWRKVFTSYLCIIFYWKMKLSTLDYISPLPVSCTLIYKSQIYLSTLVFKITRTCTLHWFSHIAINQNRQNMLSNKNENLGIRNISVYIHTSRALSIREHEKYMWLFEY